MVGCLKRLKCSLPFMGGEEKKRKSHEPRHETLRGAKMIECDIHVNNAIVNIPSN